MDLVEASVPFCFNYVDYAQSTNLFVRAAVYDVTSGSAVFVENVVMPTVAIGMYSGNFTGTPGKTYLIISVIYTDDTYATPDPNRAPAARCFQVVGNEVLYLAFAWAAFNQLSSLDVAANIYDMSSGSPVFVLQSAMAHVANGVYFGSYTGSLNHTYQALSVVYTDDTFVTPDTFYAPGGDAFQCISSIVNEITSATLVGQSLNAVLKGACT